MATWTRIVAIPESRSGTVFALGTPLKAIAAGLFAIAAVLIVYFPFLNVGLISDDYLQIHLARKLNQPGGWSELASDVLYRSRATSLVLTNLIDGIWGPDAAWHRAFNFLIHALNVLLVASLGSWRRIGYAVSTSASLVFLVIQNHQEAVVWTAALPELLVATFVLGALAAWIRAIHLRSHMWLAISFLLFLLSLISKESGVVFLPLATAVLFVDRVRWKAPLGILILGSLLSALYAAGIFQASATHLHLSDGTFVLQPGFLAVIAISMARLLFPWGLAAAVAVAFHRRDWLFGAGCLAAMTVALMPYAFLTYMSRVPSRHTYMATVALAMLIAYACVQLWLHAGQRHRIAIASVAAVFVLFNTGYLWSKKLGQYERRAASSERFLELAKSGAGQRTIRIDCAPFPLSVYQQAAELKLGWPPHLVVSGAELNADSKEMVEAESFCDRLQP